MTTVTKEMRFECAHMLTGHEGRCSNLHGHSYKVEVTLTAPVGPDSMVVDFAALKEVMNEVIDPFDHAFIFDERVVSGDGVFDDSPEGQIAKIVSINSDMRWVAFPGRPTAENMAHYFSKEIQRHMVKPLVVACVRVWETATSYAEYFPEG